jgi:outer membrane lipoprotein-sorting protein
MMKRYAVLGMIIALVVSIAAIGCSSKKSTTHNSTPTHTTAASTPTTEATAEPTEEPEAVSEMPANYQYSIHTSDSTGADVTMDVMVKGDKSRTNWTASTPGEEPESQIIINDGQFTWLYTPEESSLMKLSGDSILNPALMYQPWFTEQYYGEVSDATILASMQYACPGGASIDTQETIAGQPCTKFTCNLGGEITYQYWIADAGWLAKAVISQTGFSYTLEFTDVNLTNPSLSDDLFDISIVAPGIEPLDMTGY